MKFLKEDFAVFFFCFIFGEINKIMARFASIDIETTGLDEKTCQILSIGIILEDSLKPEIPIDELPALELILNRDYIQGEPYALNMNKDIIEIIKDGKDNRLISRTSVPDEIRSFFRKNDSDYGKIKVVGKNFGTFDLKFLKILFEETGTKDINFSHRVLDVGPLFMDFKKDDWIPNLTECMKRAGIKGEVTHDALQDAKDVIKVLRTKY